MPRNDYYCPLCGTLASDVILPIGERPTCCDRRMDWFPTQAPHVSLLDWEVDLGDGRGPRTIHSALAAHALERQQEQAARNGDPGAAPIVFRRLSQDISNADVSTLIGENDNAPTLTDIPKHLRDKVTVGELSPDDAARLRPGPGVDF